MVHVDILMYRYSTTVVHSCTCTYVPVCVFQPVPLDLSVTNDENLHRFTSCLDVNNIIIF